MALDPTTAEQLVGRLLLALYADAEMVLCHRHVGQTAEGEVEETCAVSVLRRDGKRREVEEPTLAEALRSLAGELALAPVPTRRCGSRAHLGNRKLPLSQFAAGDRYCHACRARLSAERRRVKAGRAAPGTPAAAGPPSS